MKNKTAPKIKHDDEELSILQAWEAGTLKPIKGTAKTLEKHQAAAEAGVSKDLLLNLLNSNPELKDRLPADFKFDRNEANQRHPESPRGDS
jgi:hypothetical protein